MKNKASEQELLPKTSLSDETESEITTEVSEASKNVEHAEKIGLGTREYELIRM